MTTNKYSEHKTNDLIILLNCEYLWEDEKDQIRAELENRKDNENICINS